jgi:protein gp37
VSAATGIDWTDATDNLTTWHCDPVSDECDNCFAQSIANHWHGPGYFTAAPPEIKPDRLFLSWRDKKMRAAYRHFITSMSDPFHTGLSFSDQALLWAWMAADRDHVHQVATKRDGVMRSRLTSPDFIAAARQHLDTLESMARDAKHLTPWRQAMINDITQARDEWTWPLRNVWMGVSAGTQPAADRRVSRLTGTPAATRFVSAEPLLEHVDLSRWLGQIHWVIGGGESGARHRPLDPVWARSLRDQCLQAGVAFWWKQNGGLTSKAGGDLLDGRQWKQFPPPVPGTLR